MVLWLLFALVPLQGPLGVLGPRVAGRLRGSAPWPLRGGLAGFGLAGLGLAWLGSGWLLGFRLDFGLISAGFWFGFCTFAGFY